MYRSMILRSSTTIPPAKIRRFGLLLSLRNLVLSVLICSQLPAVANSQITGLFNTGVNNSGIPLPLYGQDSHYNLITSADPNCPTILAPRVEPHPAWVNFNNAISSWIRPEQITAGIPPFNNYGVCSNGTYIYETTFNAAGNLSLLSITGRLAADDNGVSIQLNTNTPLITGPAGFSSYTNFAITSGFQSGLNTLRFRVDNLGGAPTGLRVEMVPEPAAGISLGLTLAGLALRRRWSVGV